MCLSCCKYICKSQFGADYILIIYMCMRPCETVLGNEHFTHSNVNSHIIHTLIHLGVLIYGLITARSSKIT